MFYKFDREITFNDIKKFNYPNQRIGVIIHIENDEGKILLQQRGPKSSDEQGLYEDVGGKYETKDATFKDTIIRELKEETGIVYDANNLKELLLLEYYQPNYPTRRDEVINRLIRTKLVIIN